MTIRELIAELQKSDPDVEVTMLIGGPKEGAFTNEVIEVRGGMIYGWVASDNDEAYLPGGD